MPPKPASNDPSSVNPEDRRLSPRLSPEDVPWIKEVKPLTGDNARLLNISRTGVLLETTARLQPGRRSTVVIVNDHDQKQRAEGQVVRTELVAIGKTGELIYRTALSFSRELDLHLPDAVAPARTADSLVQSQLEGPLQGIWTADQRSRRVQVTHVTATGCYVLGPGPVTEGDWASIALFFSPVRSLTVQGKVVAVEPDQGCLLHFARLSSETRRALRVEIREGIAKGAAAPPQPLAVGSLEAGGDEHVTLQWHARAGALHANQW